MKSFSISFLVLIFCLSLNLAVNGQTSRYNSDQIIERANQLHDSGYYEASIKLLSQVYRTDPNYPAACYEQALSYYYNGNAEKALSKCREADFYKYRHPFIFSLMGSILDDMGKPAEGIVILKKALAKWPYNQNLLYNLGVCYLNAGMPDSAEKVLTKSVVIYPYHTRSHMGIAKANYAMGRVAESYLAYSMAILITPNNNNIREFENVIGGKSSIVQQPYKFPYPSAVNRKKWDDLRYLLQSEYAFNKSFDYPFPLDFTFTRQSYLLFTSLTFDPADTSIYNRLYGRFFSELIKNGYFETYTNYCMKNIGSFDANNWDSKNPGKIDGFISWAQQFFDNGRNYGYNYNLEQQHISVNHFNEGKLTSVGKQEGENQIRNGRFIIVDDDGSVSERGTYVNDITEGKWYLYYPDGVVKQDLNFVHDSLDGIIKTFFPNSAVSMIYSFSKGLKNGKTSEYYSSGDLLSQYNYTRDILNGPGEYYNHNDGYIRKYNYHNDTLTGNYTETWFNGLPKLSYSLNNGNYEGLYQEFNENGKSQSVTFYNNNVKTGAWANYHYSGALSDTGNYDENGKLSGEVRSYDRSGRLTVKTGDYKDGVLSGWSIVYFSNGKESVKLQYAEDSLKQIESFDASGKSLFKAGDSHGRLPYKSYFEDGVIKQEGFYLNSKYDGIWKTYNPVGVLVSENQYKDGMQSGPQKSYYPNGSLKMEYNCDSNNIVGEYREYYMNGHLKTKGIYVKEGLQDELVNYYQNDSVSRRTFYNNGIITGSDITYSPDGYINQETVYNHDGNAVRLIEYDILHHISADLNYEYGSHQLTTKYADGKKKSVYNVSDGLLNGWFEEYYPNGQLQSRLNYIYGKPHGKYSSYDYNGNLEFEYNYNMGILTGEGKRFVDGKPDYSSWYENNMSQGEIIDYYYNGKISRTLITEDDELNGNCDYFSPDGTFMYRIRYAQGSIKAFSAKNISGSFNAEIPVSSVPSHFVLNYPNGKPAARFSLDKGLFHGKQFTYYPSGSILRESEFIYGENNGLIKDYYANGKLREQITYLNDERNGPYSEYDENGILKCSGNFLFDEKHGDWHVYEAGKETKILKYYHGDLYEIVNK